jgi:3D (Asp-Asp-Asp) domain-containing protein
MLDKMKVTAVLVSLAGASLVGGTAEASTVHEVEAGDTLSQIGNKFGVSVGELAETNEIKDVDLIHVGDAIVIDGEAPKKEEPKKKEEATGDWIPYDFTHYTASCVGCSGVTSTGINVAGTTHYQGMRVIAVNPNIIPYGSIVELKYPNGRTETAYAGDTGGAIRARTNLLDVLVSSDQEALSKGRVHGEIRFIRKGE